MSGFLTEKQDVKRGDGKTQIEKMPTPIRQDEVDRILGKKDEVIDIISADVTQIGKNENDSSYSDIVSSSLKGPYVVTTDGKADKLTIDISDAKILHLNNTYAVDFEFNSKSL